MSALSLITHVLFRLARSAKEMGHVWLGPEGILPMILVAWAIRQSWTKFPSLAHRARVYFLAADTDPMLQLSTCYVPTSMVYHVSNTINQIQGINLPTAMIYDSGTTLTASTQPLGFRTSERVESRTPLRVE